MARITPIDPTTAEGKAKSLLEGVRKGMGTVPNLMASIAHSPATLQAYLGFGQALGSGELGGKLREQIAVAVAGANACEYCASAHTALGKGQGVGETELAANLSGESGDARTAAALAFARSIVVKRGFVSDEDIAVVRSAGFGDGEIVEIVGVVAINTFTNYFNHVAETEVDFPRVEVGAMATA